MKKFAGHKTLEQIADQCKAQGLELDARKYVNEGSDFITVRGGGAHAIYSVFNGRFFGRTPDGTVFTSDSTKHDKQPWMQAFLNFFYTEKTA